MVITVDRYYVIRHHRNTSPPSSLIRGALSLGLSIRKRVASSLVRVGINCCATHNNIKKRTTVALQQTLDSCLRFMLNAKTHDIIREIALNQLQRFINTSTPDPPRFFTSLDSIEVALLLLTSTCEFIKIHIVTSTEKRDGKICTARVSCLPSPLDRSIKNPHFASCSCPGKLKSFEKFCSPA